MDKEACVVDYSWLYHKSYRTFRHLHFPVDGKLVCTGVLYGVIRDLVSLHKKYNCPIFVCLEPPSNSDRYSLYSAYKSGRKHDDDIYSLYTESLSAVALLPFVVMFSSNDKGEADIKAVLS